MARVAARARPATEADVFDVLQLFDELRGANLRAGARVPSPPNGAAAAPGPRSEAEQRYRRSLDDPSARLFVAVVDADGGDAAAERVVGMVLCSVTGSGTFVDAPVVQMNHFFVRQQARRRGAGRALIVAATAWAEERGVDGVGVAVYPDSREANRYFARLGFAPVYVHRVAPLAGLRRTLGAQLPVATLDKTSPSGRRRLRVGGTAMRPVARSRRYPA